MRNTAIVAVLLLAMHPVTAAPLLYDEARDGDLDAQQLAMDVGSNRVSGTATYLAGIGIPVDAWTFDCDAFYFTIPAGSVIESIALSMVRTVLRGTQYFSGSVNYADGWWDETEEAEPYAMAFATKDYDFLYQQGRFAPFAMPSSAGANWWRLSMLTQAGVRAPAGQLGGGEVAYTWDVSVAPGSVPEPGTLGLFCLGMLGLLLRTKHRGDGKCSY